MRSVMRRGGVQVSAPGRARKFAVDGARRAAKHSARSPEETMSARPTMQCCANRLPRLAGADLPPPAHHPPLP